MINNAQITMSHFFLRFRPKFGSFFGHVLISWFCSFNQKLRTVKSLESFLCLLFNQKFWFLAYVRKFSGILRKFGHKPNLVPKIKNGFRRSKKILEIYIFKVLSFWWKRAESRNKYMSEKSSGLVSKSKNKVTHCDSAIIYHF